MSTNYIGLGHFPHRNTPFVCDVCGRTGIGNKSQRTHMEQPCRGIKDEWLRKRSVAGRRESRQEKRRKT